MLIWATWPFGASVFRPLVRVLAGFGGYSQIRASAYSYGLIATYHWNEPSTITWILLLTGAAAGGAAFWATVLRRQVHAKTSELRFSLEAQGKARHFDVARNEVLENIARNSPLPENMERLALAIEEQIAGCACVLSCLPMESLSITAGPRLG